MAIVRRGDRYGVRIWDGAGKRHRWLGTFDRLQDAKRAEADAISHPTGVGAITVEEWAQEWQQHYARGAVATRRTYSYACQQIVDAIGVVETMACTGPGAMVGMPVNVATDERCDRSSSGRRHGAGDRHGEQAKVS